MATVVIWCQQSTPTLQSLAWRRGSVQVATMVVPDVDTAIFSVDETLCVV